MNGKDTVVYRMTIDVLVESLPLDKNGRETLEDDVIEALEENVAGYLKASHIHQTFSVRMNNG